MAFPTNAFETYAAIDGKRGRHGSKLLSAKMKEADEDRRKPSTRAAKRHSRDDAASSTLNPFDPLNPIGFVNPASPFSIVSLL